MKSGYLIGIIAGLTTGALWGLTFVAPRAVTPFNEYDLAVGRYFIFGLVSILLMILPAFRPTGINLKDATIAMLLGGVGYIFYFLATAFAVNLSGAAIPPLVIGLMPVILAIAGNISAPAVSARSLYLPLALILAGILVVNFGGLSRAEVTGNKTDLIFGIILSFVALIIWVAYGWVNSVVLRRENAPAALPWACLQGVGSAIGSSLLFVWMISTGNSYAFENFSFKLSDYDSYNFLIWCLLMGIIGSWVATWCWSIASEKLPLAITAQLIVAETIFGLIFGFIYENRLPHLTEYFGGSLQILGIMATLYLFSKTTEMSKE